MAGPVLNVAGYACPFRKTVEKHKGGIVVRVRRVIDSSLSRVFGRSLLTLLLSMLVGAAHAGGPELDAKSWLNRIVSASVNRSYEGTFVYRRDDQLVAMRIIHVGDGKKERERLIALNGRLREIIRDGDGVVYILPEQQVTLNRSGLGKHFSPKFLDNVAKLEKYYRFSLSDSDRIAGRLARMVVIEPRDTFRYGYRIWVDEDTGLLLQSDLVDEAGNAVEQVMFTSLNLVHKVSPAMVASVVVTEEMRKDIKSAPPTQAQTNSNLSWSIGQAPSGFVLAERYVHRSDPPGVVVEHGVLSDGMATVSVFVEPVGKEEPFEGVSHMGAVSAFGAVVNNRQLTVVGEVPIATVQMIGKSIAFQIQSGR